jgi:hypothetical protein
MVCSLGTIGPRCYVGERRLTLQINIRYSCIPRDGKGVVFKLNELLHHRKVLEVYPPV